MRNAKAENREFCNLIRREMSRHAVNCSEVQVQSSHGVIHLHGKVRPMRGMEGTFKSDITNLLKALRQRPGVRDVICEWTESI
ncbi:MAG: hypothetical protein OHK0029_16030 [Armatimonadaceae bacterium]